MKMQARLFVIAILALVLAGCATAPKELPLAEQPAPPQATMLPMPVVKSPAPTAPTESATDGFWQHLRTRLVLGGCEGDNPRVEGWITSYTRHPRRFQARMRQDLAKLRYVAERTEAHDIPSDFAFLPWVESNFRALPTKGNRPAGMWQIMPATGRSLGLRIDRHFDARLDLHDSTEAALALLQQNHDALGDWRLADMAYNTGRYRIKRMLAEQDVALSDRAVPDLPVSDITRDHLAKLTALACIAADPGRYGIDLPQPIEPHALTRIQLPLAVDLRLAARLAKMSLDEVKQLNAAWRDYPALVRGITLPKNAAGILSRNMAILEQHGWRDWQRARVEKAIALDQVTASSDLALILGLANARDTTQPMPVGTLAWLPKSLYEDAPQFAKLDQPPRDIHQVKSGDTLWEIARKFGVSVADLRAWNGIVGDHLRLGQKLRLTPLR